MPGLDSLCGVWDIKHVRSRPREKEARELLEKIADQVKPICVAHKWNVQMLEEFVPPNAGLLGMNVNRKKIFIRLRPASDLGSFYPYEALLHTMLHELVHMEIGPHSAKFYKMLDELRDECEKLMRNGVSGRNMPFAGKGTQLGGGRTAVDARAAASKAAEKRQRQQGIMGGGHRLGGSAGASGSAAERAAAAAEWRAAVTRGCAFTHHGASSQADGGCGGHGSSAEGGGDGGWDCDLCTLHNSSKMPACDACGTPRKDSDRPYDALCGGGADANGGHDSGGGGGGNGGARSRSTVSDGKKPAGRGEARQGLSATAAGKDPCRASHGSTSTAATAATAGGGGSSSSVGRPALSTWTCRECPFSFPNAVERSTCETCGARRPREVVGAGIASISGGTGAIQRQGLPPPPSWECGRCTMVNPKNFLDCGACRAPQAFGLGAGAAGGSFAGPDAIGCQDGAWLSGGFGVSGSGGGGGGSGVGVGVGGGVGFGSDGGKGAVGESSGRGRVCGMCTLRNPADAFVCAACGIPLAESEAAAEAASAEVAAVASTAAAAAMPTNADGSGRLSRRRRDREDNDDDDHGARRNVKANAPELIDLS